MAIEMCIIPPTPQTLNAVLYTQLVTLVASTIIFIVMLDAIRRIYNLRGNHFILEVKHFGLILCTYSLFLISGIYFIWLF